MKMQDVQLQQDIRMSIKGQTILQPKDIDWLVFNKDRTDLNCEADDDHNNKGCSWSMLH
jgi:hypothetical protein